MNARRALLAGLCAATLVGLAQPPAEANGILRNGVGARAMALGGADVAWVDDAQLDVPTARRMGTSALQAGEYSDSRTEVAVHWVAVSLSIGF